MRLVELSTAWTIALDFVAWLVIHLGVSYLSLYVPSGLLRAERWLFRTRAWERGGALYQRLHLITSEIQNNSPRTPPALQQRLNEVAIRVSIERLLRR